MTKGTILYHSFAYNKLLDVTHAHTHTTIFTGESLLECRLQIDRFCQMDQWLLTPLGRHHRGHCNNVIFLISTCTYIEEYTYGKSAEK